jgi:predicted DNA-binding protein (UPF0251 family)
MPRVKLAGDSYLDRDLVEVIRRYKYGKGLNNSEAGKLVGVAERTFARYLENPEMMNLKTLRMLQRKLQIPKEEFMQYLL